MAWEELKARGIKLYYEDEWVCIINSDCREILPELNIKVDLVLTDPPWGTRTAVDAKRFSRKKSPRWKEVDNSLIRTHDKIVGDDKEFDPRPFINQPAILWGANCYPKYLPASSGWLIWDKRENAESMAENGWPLGEAELAWTNIFGTTRVFRNLWSGLLRSEEKGEFYHPTQKPIRLMAWCIELANKFNPQTILDPYVGAGSTLIAAKKLNRKCIGIEIEEKYCEIAAKRCSQQVFDFREVTHARDRNKGSYRH